MTRLSADALPLPDLKDGVSRARWMKGEFCKGILYVNASPSMVDIEHVDAVVKFRISIGYTYGCTVDDGVYYVALAAPRDTSIVEMKDDFRYAKRFI
ncbi:MAG: hypothetical protein BWK73_25410 [Thiothrix lacustris]|uniref:Uncharacterized protein n=1 Tax=Thiothrix lacustris TaxID=525917 RepID=A0A1Y1QL85_9GAMM|nr:MAG: hypothetical protein BWK73_25410 [Thiothrix lacustris]